MKMDGVLIPSNKSNANIVNMNYVSRTHIFKVDTLGEVEWEYLSPQGQLFNYASDLVEPPRWRPCGSNGQGR